MSFYNRFFLLLLIVLTGTANAQESIYSQKILKAAKYADKAELEICNANPNLADRYYDSLFHIMPIPSGHDVWNRAILAREMGKKNLHDSLVCMLFFKGYSIDRLAKCFDTSIVRNLITPEYLAKRKVIERYYENLIENDQRANMNKVEHPREWADTWINNIQKIMELAQQVENDPHSYFTIESSVPQVCFLHFFQMWSFKLIKGNEGFKMNNPQILVTKDIDFKAIGFVPFLAEQVEKGNFDRASLAYDLNLTEYPFLYQAVSQFDNEVLVMKPNLLRHGFLDTLNTNRKFLGVSSYQEYFKKARFIDSLLTDGNPFKPIPKDSLIIFYNRKESKCVFNFGDGYRLTLFFKNPEKGEGKELIEIDKKKYFQDY